MMTPDPMAIAIAERAREKGWNVTETARRLRVDVSVWSRAARGESHLRYSVVADAFPDIAKRYRHIVPSCVTCGKPMQRIMACRDTPRHAWCPPPLVNPVKITCSQCGVRITMSRRDHDRRGLNATCGSARCRQASHAGRMAELFRRTRWCGGTALAGWRKERGWTQAELAARIGVTQPWVSNWERNIWIPTEERLAQLAVLGFRLNTE